MTQINPKKLLHSKWTAVKPKNKEKHFIVTELVFDDEGIEVIRCEIEAVITKNVEPIDWLRLQDKTIWLQGWK